MAIPKLMFPEDYDPSVCRLLPVPVALIPIIGGVMESLEWRASWRTEADWTLGEQAIIRLEECLMNGDCTSGIIEAIQQASLVSDVCCALGAGIPYFEEPADPIERGVGDPPEPFEDWEDHAEYVCRAAQALVDNLIQGVQEIEERTSAGVILSAGMLCAILAFCNPVLALVVSLAGLVVGLVAQELLDDTVDAFIDAKFDFVCAIYTATTVDGAFDAIADVITLLDLPPIGKQALACLFTTNAINAVYLGTYDVPAEYEADYCETCEAGCPLITVGLGETVGYHQYQAVLVGGGWWYVELMFRMPVWLQPCGDPLDITIAVISGSVQGSPIEKRWRCYDGDGTMTYQSDDPPTWPYCCQCIDIKSSTPFTIELSFQECE